MALSDYLTNSEWDACFYASIGQHYEGNLGKSIHRIIDALLTAGHQFPGLNGDGSKKVQVENGVNAPKLCIFFGNPHEVDILGILDNGRNFLKERLPELVDETDEEWTAQIENAQKQPT